MNSAVNGVCACIYVCVCVYACVRMCVWVCVRCVITLHAGWKGFAGLSAQPAQKI